MKKVMIVFWMLLLSTFAHGDCIIKMASEKLAIFVCPPLDSAGLPIETSDSMWVMTWSDNGTSTRYEARSTTAPFSDIGFDTVLATYAGLTNLRYVYNQTISTIDGTAGNFQLGGSITAFTKGLPTHTNFCVQVVADSLTKTISLVSAYLNATISSRSSFNAATDSVTIDKSNAWNLGVVPTQMPAIFQGVTVLADAAGTDANSQIVSDTAAFGNFSSSATTYLNRLVIVRMNGRSFPTVVRDVAFAGANCSLTVAMNTPRNFAANDTLQFTGFIWYDFDTTPDAAAEIADSACAQCGSSADTAAIARSVWDSDLIAVSDRVIQRLTELDEDNTTIDLNASYVGGLTTLDEDLTVIDINGQTIATATTTGTVNALAADAITAAAIAADAIGASEIAADAIGASEVAANAIGASEIASAAIVNGTEATGFMAPTDSVLVDGSILAGMTGIFAVGQVQTALFAAIGASAWNNSYIAESARTSKLAVTGSDADTGIAGLKTKVQAIKAKTDKLTFNADDSLIVDYSNMPAGGGSGSCLGDGLANACTLYVFHSSTPIEGMYVKVNNTSENATMARGYTDANGRIIMNLDTSVTYKVRVYRANVTQLTNPQSLTLTSNGANDTVLVDTTPVSNEAVIIGNIDCYECAVRFTLASNGQAVTDTSTNRIITRRVINTKTDADGFLTVTLPKTQNMLYKDGTTRKQPQWIAVGSPTNVNTEPKFSVSFSIPSDSTQIDIGELIQ